MYASEIALQMLNWMLPRLNESDIVGAEVRIQNAALIADLVIATEKALIGFEIKSIKDNLDRFTTQGPAYKRLFHASYIVAPTSIIPAISRLIKKHYRGLGIIELRDTGAARVLIQPKIKPVLLKADALLWLDRRALQTLLKKGAVTFSGNTPVEELRSLAEQKCTAVTINKFAIDAVRRKLQARHSQMVDELGRVITLDDLATLRSGPSQVAT